jgi:hypothetical protein
MPTSSPAASALAPHPPREPFGWYVAVLLGYLALAVVITWPLVLGLDRVVVQRHDLLVDAGQGVWNLWWARESLLRGWNPFITEYIFFPQRVNLFYQTLSLPNALLVFPALVAFGPAVAFNLVGLLSFALGGLLSYLVARGLAGRVAALAAGLVFGFSAYHMQAASGGAMEIIAIHWIPFSLLVLLRALRSPTMLRWLAAAGALLLATLASSYYGLFLAVYSGAHVLLFVLAETRRHKDAKTRKDAENHPGLRAFVLSCLRGLVILYAVWAGTLLLFIGPLGDLEDSLMGDWYERQVFQAAAVVDYLAPNVLHPLWGRWSAQALSAVSPVGTEAGATLGLSVALLVALALARRWRLAWSWGALALVCALLSLGPELKLASEPTGVPLPYALLNLLGPFRNSTRPNYWIGVLMLPVSVLVALGVDALKPRQDQQGPSIAESPRLRALRGSPHVLLIGLLLFELWPGQLPLMPLRASPSAARAAQDETLGAMLELPPRTNDSRAMLNQICHGRPLAGGYLARTPDYPPVNGASALRRLWLADAEQPDIFGHDPAGELATLGVRFVALNLAQMSGARAERLRGLLQASEIARTDRADDVELYAVAPGAARPFAQPERGWQPAENEGGRTWRWIGDEATLRVVARVPSLVTFELAATAYGHERPLRLTLNGVSLGEVAVPAAPATGGMRLRLLIPAGVSRLTLASQAERAPDGRRLSLSVSALRLTGAALPAESDQRVLAVPATLPAPPGIHCP